VIEMRRAQRSFGDGLIAEEVKDLREGWMDHADRLLDDEARAFEADSRTCAVASRLPSSNNRACSGAPTGRQFARMHDHLLNDPPAKLALSEPDAS